MSAEVKKELHLEIAHVLFIDAVGYSKLLITEQSEQLQTLKAIVRGTEQVRLGEAEGKLLRLPTGDLIDAALGRKEAALQEGRRAIALLPEEKDNVNGSRMLQYFAIIAAWAGEKELALQQLETALRAPYASIALSYGRVKLLPFWDPLRGDPRFEKIVASLAPKDN